MLVLLIMALVLPVVLAFVLPVGLIFWFGLFLTLTLSALLMRAVRALAGEPALSAPMRLLYAEEHPEALRQVMDIQLATEEAGVRVFRGPLRDSAAAAYSKLKSFFGREAVPVLREDQMLGAAVMLLPKETEAVAPERKVGPWVHWLLFALTLITTTGMGAAYAGVNILREPFQAWVGLPYSLGLLAILGFHELGHYFAARRHGMDVSPPFFIPVPFALGTFGAFIRMRSPPENRRSLFDMAIAGPLAGLVVALPALFVGLKTSLIFPASVNSPFIPEGLSVQSSLLLAVVAKGSLGSQLASDHLIQLSPLAFAGWIGLLVTALNLLPIGQLDGGHIARAMFGHRIGNWISTVAVALFVVLAIFVWPSLIIWALIVLLIARRGTPPLNDLSPISAGRVWLGFGAFAILALILLPAPTSLWGGL